MSKNSVYKANIIGTLAPICWSTVPVSIYFLSHIPALLTTAICLFTFSIIELTRQLIKKNIIAPHMLPLSYHLNGIMGIVGLHVFYFSALKLTSISLVFLIINLGSVFIIFYSKFILKTEINNKHYIGISLSLLGIIILALSNHNNNLEYDNNFLGILFAIMAANFWGLYSVISRKFTEITVERTVYPCLWSALICFSIFLLSAKPIINISLNDLLILLYISLFPVGYALFFWNYGMKYGDIRIVSILAYINPPIAATLVIIFGIEEFNLYLLAAVILISLGSYFAARKQNTTT